MLTLNTKALATEIFERQQQEAAEQEDQAERSGKKNKSTGKPLFGWKNYKAPPAEHEDLEQLRQVHGIQPCSHTDTRGATMWTHGLSTQRNSKVVRLGQGQVGVGGRLVDSEVTREVLQEINALKQKHLEERQGANLAALMSKELRPCLAAGQKNFICFPVLLKLNLRMLHSTCFLLSMQFYIFIREQ